MGSLDEILRNSEEYVTALDNCDYERGKAIVRTAVSEVRKVLQHGAADDSEEFLDAAFRTAVFFRALYDFALLQELTSDKDWFHHKKSLETAWHKLWDCKDRLGFARLRITGATVDRMALRLSELEAFYFTHFGHGLYASPVILLEREICSVCGADLRRCSHLTGRIYKGRLCAAIPEIRDLKSVDFVQVPRDPRCRIWPWQVKGDKISSIKIMCVFQLDDFSETEEWK